MDISNIQVVPCPKEWRSLGALDEYTQQRKGECKIG